MLTRRAPALRGRILAKNIDVDGITIDVDAIIYTQCDRFEIPGKNSVAKRSGGGRHARGRRADERRGQQ